MTSANKKSRNQQVLLRVNLFTNDSTCNSIKKGPVRDPI